MTRASLLATCALLALTALVPAAEAQELSWGQQMFEKSSINFGTVARGADCSYRVRMKNLYQETIYITNVSTACSCASASASTTKLAAGETGYLDIKIDTVRFMRERKTAAIIQLSEPTKGLAAEVRIPLQVYIRTDVVLQPGSVNFGVVEMGQPATRHVSISYAGRPDWKIVQVRSQNPHVVAEAKETSRSGGQVTYDLEVTLSKDAPASAIREQLILMTDDAGSPQVPVALEASIESDVMVSPSTLQFGSLKGGQSKTINLVVRGRKPIRIEAIEREQTDDTLKVKLPKDTRPVHVLPITFAAPATTSEINEVLTITIEGREKPLEIRVQGKVKGTTAASTSAAAPVKSTPDAAATTPAPAATSGSTAAPAATDEVDPLAESLSDPVAPVAEPVAPVAEPAPAAAGTPATGTPDPEAFPE